MADIYVIYFILFYHYRLKSSTSFTLNWTSILATGFHDPRQQSRRFCFRRETYNFVIIMLGWFPFMLYFFVAVCEDGTLFPIARLDFPCRSVETNDHVKRNLTSKDPEQGRIFPAIFGTRMHFTFLTKPTAFIHPKTSYWIPSSPLLSPQGPL